MPCVLHILKVCQNSAGLDVCRDVSLAGGMSQKELRILKVWHNCDKALWLTGEMVPEGVRVCDSVCRKCATLMG